MKIALLNLANNVSTFKTTPSGETIYLKKTLEEMGHEVDIISNKETEFAIPFEAVKDINGYDRLLVQNGAINFFGGKESPTIMNNYRLMAQYKKTIYYLLTDLRLPFNQVWPAIEKRGWGYKKEDVWVTSKVKVISQGRNLDVAKAIHKKAILDTDMEFDYFPLDRYKLYMSGAEFAEPTEKECDLIYGGSFRGGSREGKMNEFLFDTGLSVEFFGTAKETQFKSKKYPWTQAPMFSGKIEMTEVSARNSTAYATIVMGDTSYNDNYMTLRVWETMASDAVMFIDHEFDTKHTIVPDDRFYVRNKAELASMINQIKESPELRKELLEIQHNALLAVYGEKANWQIKFNEAIA